MKDELRQAARHPGWRAFAVAAVLAVAATAMLGGFRTAKAIKSYPEYGIGATVDNGALSLTPLRAWVDDVQPGSKPTGGLCAIDPPPAAMDRLLIASGGLLAQLVVFVLTLGVVALSGDFTSPVANGFVVVFTLFNAILFLGNLIPYRYNDGSMIFKALRDLWRRRSA